MSSSSFLEMIAATKEARIRYRQELCYAVMPVAVSYYIDLPSGDKEAKAADEVVSFVDTLLDRLVKASKITFQRRHHHGVKVLPLKHSLAPQASSDVCFAQPAVGL